MAARQFAYNPTHSVISGTINVGDICVGVDALDYSSKPGGLAWWMGPDETAVYVIAKDVPTQDYPTPFGNIGSVHFWSCQKTDLFFISLVSRISQGASQSSLTGAYSWLASNGYWTSHPEPTIILDELLINLDAGDPSSYPGSGSSWTNLGTAGSLYDANIVGSPAYSSLPYGNLSFTGGTSYAAFTRPVSDDFTIGCWVKIPIGGGNGNSAGQWYDGAGLVDCEVGGVQNDFGLAIGYDTFMFGVGNPDTTIKSASIYNDDTWHYVAATRSSTTGTIELYVDGIIISSGTGGTSSINSATNVNIGRLQTGINYMNGYVSAVHIYNKVLTDSEILQNYTVKKSSYGL